MTVTTNDLPFTPEARAALDALYSLKAGTYRKVELMRAMEAATGVSKGWAEGLIRHARAAGAYRTLTFRVGKHNICLVDHSPDRLRDVWPHLEPVEPSPAVLDVEPMNWRSGKEFGEISGTMSRA